MILAVFAHPDDEIGVGSTLAYYALGRGIPITLACATRGEAATIYCGDCARPDNLAEVRTRELLCACRHLGITDLRWLDWPDGGIQDAPRAASIGAIVALIRELQPDVIITHPRDGLYPHPDHLAVWEIVRAAFDAAADAAAYPEAGQPWAAARLFTRALPQSFFDAVPAYASYRVELNGASLPFHATPDELIDVRMRVGEWGSRRMSAWDCHLSQHNPSSPFSGLPDGLSREMAETEYFVLAAARIPLPSGQDGDLFAGLDQDDAPPIDAAFSATLRASLAEHRALATIVRDYLQAGVDHDEAVLFTELEEAEHNIIYTVARDLRGLGEPAGIVAADDKLVAAARRQKNREARLSFVRNALRKCLDRYRSLKTSAPSAVQRAQWERLEAMVASALLSESWPQVP